MNKIVNKVDIPFGNLLTRILENCFPDTFRRGQDSLPAFSGLEFLTDRADCFQACQDWGAPLGLTCLHVLYA